jgi:hypothetical protein
MFGWGKKDRKRERSVAVELEESGEEKPSYGLPTPLLRSEWVGSIMG